MRSKKHYRIVKKVRFCIKCEELFERWINGQRTCFRCQKKPSGPAIKEMMSRGIDITKY